MCCWLLVRQQVRHRMRLYTLLLVPFAFLLVVLSLPWLLLAMGEAMAGNDAAFDRWVDRAPLSRWLDRK